MYGYALRRGLCAAVFVAKAFAVFFLAGDSWTSASAPVSSPRVTFALSTDSCRAATGSRTLPAVASSVWGENG